MKREDESVENQTCMDQAFHQWWPSSLPFSPYLMANYYNGGELVLQFSPSVDLLERMKLGK